MYRSVGYLHMRGWKGMRLLHYQKKEMEMIWQRRWEKDQKGRGYHKIQKVAITKRLKMDHTGLNGTLFELRKGIVKLNYEVKENIEQFIMHFSSYNTERERLNSKVREAGLGWSLMGILGTEGEGGGAAFHAKFELLDLGLMVPKKRKDDWGFCVDL